MKSVVARLNQTNTLTLAWLAPARPLSSCPSSPSATQRNAWTRGWLCWSRGRGQERVLTSSCFHYLSSSSSPPNSLTASHPHLHRKQVHASKMADEVENIPPSPAAAGAASDDKSPPASSSEPSSSTDSAPAAARESAGVAKSTPVKKPAGTATPGAAAKVRLSETSSSIRTPAHTPLFFQPSRRVDNHSWHRRPTGCSKDCRTS